MESIPESPTGSPVFYRGISHLEIPIGFSKRNRSYSGHDDLSRYSLTSSIQTHESRVLRLCNKKYPLLNLGDNISSDSLNNKLPRRFENRSRDQFDHVLDSTNEDDLQKYDSGAGTKDDVILRQECCRSVDSTDYSHIDYKVDDEDDDNDDGDDHNYNEDVQRKEDIKLGLNWAKKQLV